MTEITIETLEENGVEVEDAEETRPVGRPKKEIDMDLVVSAHEGGYSAAEIVELLAEEGTSVCAATIRTRLKSHGHELKKGARKIDILPEEITALYTDKGLTLAATADALDVSVVTLRSRMEEFDIETRPRGRRPDPAKAAERKDDRAEVEFEVSSGNETLEGATVEFTPFPSNPHLGTSDDA